MVIQSQHTDNIMKHKKRICNMEERSKGGVVSVEEAHEEILELDGKI